MKCDDHILLSPNATRIYKTSKYSHFIKEHLINLGDNCLYILYKDDSYTILNVEHYKEVQRIAPINKEIGLPEHIFLDVIELSTSE